MGAAIKLFLLFPFFDFSSLLAGDTNICIRRRVEKMFLLLAVKIVESAVK